MFTTIFERKLEVKLDYLWTILQSFIASYPRQHSESHKTFWQDYYVMHHTGYEEDDRDWPPEISLMIYSRSDGKMQCEFGRVNIVPRTDSSQLVWVALVADVANREDDRFASLAIGYLHDLAYRILEMFEDSPEAEQWSNENREKLLRIQAGITLNASLRADLLSQADQLRATKELDKPEPAPVPPASDAAREVDLSSDWEHLVAELDAAKNSESINEKIWRFVNALPEELRKDLPARPKTIARRLWIAVKFKNWHGTRERFEEVSEQLVGWKVPIATLDDAQATFKAIHDKLRRNT